jgi:transcriptional regulator with XRE-family HTH domain
MPTAGDRIREVREKRRLTQDQLAEKADVSKSFLSEVENDKRSAGAETLLKIANALGASIDYLLRGAVHETAASEPVTIPPELSRAAQELGLSYSQTLGLLDAHRSIVARRTAKSVKDFTVEDWKQLNTAIKKVFG